MANISLTNVCNLRCPYCFAKDYTDSKPDEITMEAFAKALDFIASSHNPNEKVGLIGGEPTLHSRFGDILDILAKDHRFSYIHIFTNGICVGDYISQLQDPKFHVLINCNCEENIGARAYRSMFNNIDLLMKERNISNRVTLGINIAEADFHYQYIIDLLKKYDMHTLRLAIASPNCDVKRNADPFKHFDTVKPNLMRFVFELLDNDIIPCYDCNKLPFCFLTEDEIKNLNNAMSKICHRLHDQYLPSRGFDKHDFAVHSATARCFPAIDILQDLTAIRCFGLSNCSRVNIQDFASINELRNYYIEKFDEKSYYIYQNDKCSFCSLRESKQCMGGCLAYKFNQISLNK